jgi:hypothetical protein
MVDVHGLDPDPAGPGHLCEVHPVAHHSRLHVLLHGVQAHRGVLVEETARLDEDLLSWPEGPLETKRSMYMPSP